MMTDWLLNETGDLAIVDNDVQVGESTKQHQRLLLLCEKGAYKQTPTACVGSAGYLEGENLAAFLREVRKQFTKDGMVVNLLNFQNGKLLIDASYS
jgi:myo-inositol-1-phosphate synthase